jgi:hypothetical protein
MGKDSDNGDFGTSSHLTQLATTAQGVWAEFEESLIEIVTHSRSLRTQAREGLYGADQGPEALHAHLITHRRCLDVLEGYLAELGRVKAGLAIQVSETKAGIEDRETEAMFDTSRRTPEFLSAQERNARLRGESLEERVIARRADLRLSQVTAAYEYVRTLYRGLEQSRNDLVQRVKLTTLTTALEKG